MNTESHVQIVCSTPQTLKSCVVPGQLNITGLGPERFVDVNDV